MYVLEWGTVSALLRGLFFCLFPELWSNKGNKHKKNTRGSTETFHHETTYIKSFLTWHNKSINEDKNDDLCTSSQCLTWVFVLLMTSRSIADEVTIMRRLWCDHVNSDIKLVRYWFYSQWCSLSCKKKLYWLLCFSFVFKSEGLYWLYYLSC